MHLLVPSSYCVRNGHIMRMYYLVRCLSSLLNAFFQPMGPTSYGWEDNNGFPLPKKFLRKIPKHLINTWMCKLIWVYGVVVSMFDFHRSDRGSNPGRGGKISQCSRLHYRAASLAIV